MNNGILSKEDILCMQYSGFFVKFSAKILG